ncbi:MAG: Crp/Fnr family transcriptional regulator [Rubrivivax sp.]
MSIDAPARPHRPSNARPTGTAIDCADCPLRPLDAFQACTDAELSVIEGIKQAELRYETGAILIAEGADDPPLFTLREGWAFRFKTLPDGRRQILSILLPGDFIGLQQKMSDAAAHGVQTLTPVLVCRFRRDAVWRLHQELPSLGYDVTWLAAHENALLDENLLSLGQRTALERLAALLLLLHARAAPHDPLADTEGLLFPLTQRHLSDALGLSLVHTHRTLRSLRDRGLYALQGDGRLALPDPPGLARIAKLRWPLVVGRRPLI